MLVQESAVVGIIFTGTKIWSIPARIAKFCLVQRTELEMNYTTLYVRIIMLFNMQQLLYLYILQHHQPHPTTVSGFY